MTSKPNTDAIVKLAKEKSIKVRNKVEKTISEMALRNEKINFNTVSKKADVSKSWLYKEKDIRERIELLRKRQFTKVSNPPKNKVRSEEVLIKSLKSRIKELEQENKDLRKQLEKAYGNIFD